MDNLQLDIDFLINNPAIREAVRKARLDIAGLADGAQKDADRINSAFTNISRTLAGIFTVAAAKSFVTELINVRGEFQQLEIAFGTILQSKEKANALMAEVVQLAARTPFSLTDAAQGAKQLLAYGTASQDVVKTLKMIGNVASGVSAPLNDIIYLYGTLQASGRVTQMDINQFAGRGIPIYQALADVTGKNTTAIKDMVSAGKIGFPEIQAAFERMTGAGGQFYNLMEAQSKSLTGQISNLGDAWEQMLNNIGKSQEGVLSDGIAGVASLVENYETVLNILGVLVATYGAYKAAVITTTAVQAIATSVTNGYTIAETLRFQAMLLSEKAMKLLNATMLSNPYVLAATAITGVVTALLLFSSACDGASQAASTLAEINKEATASYDVEKSKLQQLLEVANNEALSKERRIEAIKNINRLSPTQLGNITLETLKTKESTDALNAYLSSLEKSIQLKIANEKLEKLIREKNEGIGTFDAVVGDFAALFKAGPNTVDADFKKAKDQAINAVKAEIKNIIQKQDEADKNVPPAAKPRTVAFLDAAIKDKKDAQENVTTKAEYAKLQKEINALEAEKVAITGNVSKAEKKQANERLEFLKKLADKEAEVKRKGVEKDESEIQKAQKTYADLRKEADKLKLGAGAKERINNAEKEEIGYLKYDQQTEEIKKQLEKQKTLYADFEEYKKNFGDTKAKERFKGQIDVEKTYLQAVEALNKEFEGKTNLTGGEGSRKEFVTKEYEDAKQAAQRVLDQQYYEAFEASKTHIQKLLDIDRDYQEKVKALRDKATPEQLANLKRIRDEKIQAENSANLQQETDYSNTLLVLDTLAKGAALKELERIKVKLEAERAANRISLADYRQKIDEINGHIARINGTDGSSANPFKNAIDAVDHWRDTLSKVPADSVKAKNAFKNAAGAIGEAANGAADIVGSVAKGLDSLGIGGEQLQKDMANVQGMLGGIGDLAKGIASGNPVDIVKGSINLLTNAFELFNFKDKKTEKRIKAYQQQLKGLGKAFDDLERSINNSVGESYYADSESTIKNLRQQQQLLSKSINEERSKKKADQGKIDAWQSELDSIPGKILDIQKSIAETLVQTTFKDLANNLADAFTEAFKVGEDAAGRFDDVFNQVIQNAVKNSLKLKLIEKPVAEFTDALATYMKGNGNSVAGFDFEKWKKILKDAGDSMTASLQGFGDFFKTDVATTKKADDNTLTEAVKGITSDEAGLLAGQFGGQRIATLEGNQIAKANGQTMMEQLSETRKSQLTLIEIANNTGRTADNTDRLEAVEKSLKSIDNKMNGNNALRAAGG